tara:strand:- start:4225 stop:10845 length:6621 start_codon:yes stop_codon:yes gene_type:complete
VAKRIPLAYRQKVGQEADYEVPGAYREQASARGELKDPIKIFKKGFESGGYNVAANLNYFSALANSIKGDEAAMRNNIAQAERNESYAGAIMEPVEDFHQFLDEPTFGGFVNQISSATGQFGPSAINSFLSALAGAGAGAILAGPGGATAGTFVGFAKSLTGNVAKKEINRIAKKRMKGLTLDKDENDILEGAYQTYRKQMGKPIDQARRAKFAKRGGVAGAVSQEYPQGAGIAFGTFAEQDMTDPVQAFQSLGLGVPFTAVGVGGEALVFKGFVNQIKKGSGKAHKTILQSLGAGAARSSSVEGLTELLQEEITVRQKFAIDDDYTAAMANMDRAQAAFMGFFGGAGIGAATGTATGVINKARGQIKDVKIKNDLEAFYKERYGENEPGTVYTEPEAWLEAQIEAMIDPANNKEAVYVDPDSFNQLFELLKNKPELRQKLQDAGVTQHIAGDKEASKSMGMLLTTNPELRQRFQEQTENENLYDTAALDNSLAEILGYSHSRDKAGDLVVEVLNDSNVPVWYQNTNIQDEASAKEAAIKLFGPDANIVTKPVEQHVEERNKAITPIQKELFEDAEQQPKKRSMDLEDQQTAKEDEALIARYQGLLKEIQIKDRENVKKGLPTKGIENLSPQKQQTLRQDFQAIELIRQGASGAQEAAPEGQLQQELEGIASQEEQVDELDLAALDDRMASFAAGAMGATSFESELVTDEPGSKADPIKSYNHESQTTEQRQKEEGWKGNDPTRPMSAKPNSGGKGVTAAEAYETSKENALVYAFGFQPELIANIKDNIYSGSLLKNFAKRSKEAGQAFYFDIIEIGQDEDGTPRYGMLKYTLPGELDMDVEVAHWVSQARIKARGYIAAEQDSSWKVLTPENKEKGVQPQFIDMPRLTSFGRGYNNRTKSQVSATGDLETANQGFQVAAAEALVLGYEFFWSGEIETTNKETGEVTTSTVKDRPIGELTAEEEASAIVYTRGRGDQQFSMTELAAQRGEFSDKSTELQNRIQDLENAPEEIAKREKKLATSNSLSEEQRAKIEAEIKDLENPRKPYDSIEQELAALQAALKTEEEATAAERDLSRQQLAGTDTQFRNPDEFTATGGESGAAGGTTGESATVPVNQDANQERTREIIRRNRSKINRVIRENADGLGKMYTSVLALISAREVTLNDTMAPQADKTQAQQEINDLTKEKERLEKELGIAGNLKFIRQLETQGSYDPELAQRAIPRLEAGEKTIALDSTDMADARAADEFKNRPKDPLQPETDRRGPVSFISKKVTESFQDVKFLPTVMKIVRNDFQNKRDIYVFTTDDVVTFRDVGNNQVLNEIMKEQEYIRQGNAGGRIISYQTGADGADFIIIDAKKGASAEAEGKAAISLMHELGHSILEQEFSMSLKQNSNAYKLLVKNFKKFELEQDLNFPGMEGEKNISARFEEHGANQIAKFLLDETAKATDGGEAIYKRIAAKLRAFFKKMSQSFRNRFKVDPAFDEYITKLISDRKRGLGNPQRTPNRMFNSAIIRSIVIDELPKISKNAGSKPAVERLARTAKKLAESESKTARWVRKALGTGKEVVYTADNMLRGLGPIGVKIANILYSQSQTTSELGWSKAKQQKIYEYTNKIARILGFEELSEVTDEAMEILYEAEDGRKNTDKLSPKAREIREFLSKMYDDENFAKYAGIRKMSNYFPRSIALQNIENSTVIQDKVVALLVEFNKGKKFKDGEKEFTITPKVAREMVNLLITDPENTNIDLYSEAGKFALGLSKSRSDVFRNIPTTELRNAKDEQGNSALVNPAQALRNYVTSTIKRNELNKRGGAKRIQELIDQLPTEKDKEIATSMVLASLGKINPELFVKYPKLKTANSWALTANIFGLLALTVFASFPDVAGPVLRSKELPKLRETAKIFYNALKGDEEAMRLAYDIGAVSTDAINMMFVNAGEMDYMTEGSKRANEAFFKYTGTEWFTKFTRVFSAGMGKSFIIDHGIKAQQGDPRSIRYLKELGLTSQDVADWNAGEQSLETTAGKKVKVALYRFVDESIVRPNASERPAWASDPRFALVWQLKSFFYAYGKTVIGGIGREMNARREEGESMSQSAAPLLLAAATLIPLTMLGFDLRERFKGGLAWALPGVDSTERNYRKSLDMDYGEYSMEILDRSGALGPFALMLPVISGKTYGDPFFVGPLGPTFEKLWDFPQGKLKIDDFIPGYNQVGGFDREN